MLFNRFVLVHFLSAGKVFGGRQEFLDGRLVIPPTIEFDVSHTTDPSPNEATITIYNLSPAAQKELFVEGARIRLEAGYWPYNDKQLTGTIFEGQLRQVHTYVSDGVDVVSELSCGDSDDALNVRRARWMLPAGTTHGQIIARLAEDMAKDGVTVGTINVPDYVEPRPVTIDRPAWREIEDICHQHDLLWSVQDGVLNVYSADKPLTERTLVLTERHGVIDVPEFTHDGVAIKTLMLPELRPGHPFILQNTKVLNRAPERYRIEEVNFSGSNVGGDFGCDIKAKLLSTEGNVKRSRDRTAGRRA